MTLIWLFGACCVCLNAAPIIYSVTGNSQYSTSSNQAQAEIYVSQGFALQVPTVTTFQFSATYTQTPHVGVGGPACAQDLHTAAFTTPNLDFYSYPELGICDARTRAEFPCLATFQPGTYTLNLFINDVTFTGAFIGAAVLPFSDTLTVEVTPVSVSNAPEPSSLALGILGCLLLIIGYAYNLNPA